MIIEEVPNPVPKILAVVLVLLVLFIGANVGLWWWAQQNVPNKPKKVSGCRQAVSMHAGAAWDMHVHLHALAACQL